MAQVKLAFDKTPRMALDASLASSLSSNALTFSVNRLHPIAFKGRFSVGYGLRFTGYYGQDNGYVTAPADVSEGNFFKKQNEAKLDALYLTHSSVGFLNAAVYLDYLLSEKLSLQFNIDAVGFSFGADRSGRYEADSENLSSANEAASVTSVNLLLTGDCDIGSLNSEFSLLYRISDNMILRTGVSFVFTEFTTNNKLAFNNDRFRKKSLMPMLGFSYLL